MPERTNRGKKGTRKIVVQVIRYRPPDPPPKPAGPVVDVDEGMAEEYKEPGPLR